MREAASEWARRFSGGIQLAPGALGSSGPRSKRFIRTGGDLGANSCHISCPQALRKSLTAWENPT